MYRLLKWSYEKGVEHERLRIKKLIAEFSTQVQKKHDEMEMYHSKFDKPTAEEKQHDLETHYRAMEILDKLLERPPLYRDEVGVAPIDND